MLVEGPGLESLLSRGTDDQSGDLSTAVADVGLIPFIEGDDQQALTLKRWAGHQRGNADGSALVYSTYLGGSSDFNFGQSIAVDSAGSVYLTGATGAPDFPTVKPIQPTNQGIRDAFVTKISPDGSALIYSTYLGGSGDDYGWGIAVDSAGNAHVTGDTPSRDFPVFKALQPTFHEGANFNTFVSEINADGSALIYSTY